MTQRQPESAVFINSETRSFHTLYTKLTQNGSETWTWGRRLWRPRRKCKRKGPCLGCVLLHRHRSMSEDCGIAQWYGICSTWARHWGGWPVPRVVEREGREKNGEEVRGREREREKRRVCWENRQPNNRNGPKYPNRWLHKQNVLYSQTEYYSAATSNKMLINTATWMSSAKIMLCKKIIIEGSASFPSLNAINH